MTTQQYPETATKTAQQYYNSGDADAFYHTIWGGEDIHIGLYDSTASTIADASARTVEQMMRYVEPTPESSVLDLGAGYGGAARALARSSGCFVTALNLSEVENERNREKNLEAGLSDRIDVVDGSFEDIPFGENRFDIVWSQDAMLHSGRREQVLSEVARVLKPGGQFVFTDPMRTDECPTGVLDPILARLHLDDLACPAFYRKGLGNLGLVEARFDERPQQLAVHYQRVLDETVARRSELAAVVSDEYLARMEKGLRHWVDGGRRGYLTWGIFHFRSARK